MVPNVTGHAFNRTAINVTWDIALPQGFKLRGFNVTYRALVNNTWGQNNTVRVNEPERTVVLTGLNVSTEYEIKVAAATNYQGPYSQAILVKTSEGGEGKKVMLIRLSPPPHPPHPKILQGEAPPPYPFLVKSN